MISIKHTYDFIKTITFYLLSPPLYLISLLPLNTLYKLSDLCFLLVYHILQYRRKVVYTNLRRVFTNKTPAELEQLAQDFYHYLCDLILEHVKNLTISAPQTLQRCKLRNPELLDQLHAQGKHIILVAGHYGNWEWAGNAIALQTRYQFNALYKPLSHPYFDRWVQHMRTRFGRKLTDYRKAFPTMRTYKATPTATAILADQSPQTTQACVTTFLNQPTHVFRGVEKLARKLDHPVVYISMYRVRRGYYQAEAKLLFAAPTTTPPDEITIAHTRQLEIDIRNQPATWLWSHKRWLSTDCASVGTHT
ncbi:MAG: lysophospholipid acyltransferase family protein [Bacteroidota bacterium]